MCGSRAARPPLRPGQVGASCPRTVAVLPGVPRPGSIVRMPPTDLLRVRDLVPDFLACAERSGPPQPWTSRYLAGHPDVVRALRRDGDWSDAAGVAAALDGLRDRAADLAARAETVRAALPGRRRGGGRGAGLVRRRRAGRVRGAGRAEPGQRLGR